MWKKALLLVSVLVMPWFATAANIDSSNPYQMMKAVAEKSFDRLKNEQEKVHQDPQYLKVIVEEELMPYVNDQYAALKLLGPNLKGAKREDVAEFVKAFRDYLVTNYAQVLTQYTDQTIEFGPEMPLEGDRRITSVKVEIVDTPRPNIKLEFKLRQEKSGEWKAFDMIAEGVSLLSSKQSEWSGKIRQQGILAVAQELDQLANQPIRFESQNQ
ncbi:phospholipid-binding protein MlaC [Vibrio metoecus]|uniref:phospholipid-binding protein MlaC n=1 Tax=Vibrio metoecus TaxID=1481663 RepID=UPI000BA9A30B|nr:phospholipid-binding protein MlaC [Vibrio metoecus]PAR37114.1 phospholipid-binding protein MlaC [Vibrio metoecus]PAR42194.1 phospholipid-binding protein MlaC [Vibrio metoecus]